MEMTQTLISFRDSMFLQCSVGIPLPEPEGNLLGKKDVPRMAVIFHSRGEKDALI